MEVPAQCRLRCIELNGLSFGTLICGRCREVAAGHKWSLAQVTLYYGFSVTHKLKHFIYPSLREYNTYITYHCHDNLKYTHRNNFIGQWVLSMVQSSSWFKLLSFLVMTTRISRCTFIGCTCICIECTYVCISFWSGRWWFYIVLVLVVPHEFLSKHQ